MLHGTDKGIVAENARELKSKGHSERASVLISMKQAKKNAAPPSVQGAPDQDNYPYGLRLDLNHEVLKKLGLAKLPAVGDKHTLTAHTKVDSVSESSHSGEDGGKARRSVNLQITHMKLA